MRAEIPDWVIYIVGFLVANYIFWWFLAARVFKLSNVTDGGQTWTVGRGSGGNVSGEQTPTSPRGRFIKKGAGVTILLAIVLWIMQAYDKHKSSHPADNGTNTSSPQTDDPADTQT